MFFPEGVDDEQCSSYTQQQSQGIKRKGLFINAAGGWKGGRGFGCMLKGKPIVRTKDEAGASKSQGKHCHKKRHVYTHSW